MQTELPRKYTVFLKHYTISYEKEKNKKVSLTALSEEISKYTVKKSSQEFCVK